MGPIFNIFLNKVVVGPVNSAYEHCANSALCLLKAETRASKKKKTRLFRFIVAWVPTLIKH